MQGRGPSGQSAQGHPQDTCELLQSFRGNQLFLSSESLAMVCVVGVTYRVLCMERA